MACTTCSSEPVALASSTAVLTAGPDSLDPSVASNIFVGYIAKKLLRRCPGVEAISTPTTVGAVYRASLIAYSLVPSPLYAT